MRVTVGAAKDAARRWVAEHAGEIDGFYGAFFHGSVNWLCEDGWLSPTSDLDVMIVLDGADTPAKPGKLIYGGVLLEVSHVVRDRLRSAEQVLGDYHLAGSFQGESVFADPSGELTALQEAVSRDYAKQEWVRRRCEHARENALGFLDGVREDRPFHEQAVSWLFANGVLCHVLLVAGLRNPTVRKRYLSVRELLADYDRLEFYETLLESLGCAHWNAAQAAGHLEEVARAFDTAKEVLRTPYRFASDLTDLARPVAIDGSRELIETGHYREAVFWIAATSSRCQWVLAHDAPADAQSRFYAGYNDLLTDLGIESFADLERRSGQVRALLPRVWDAAQELIAANPEIA